MRETIKQKPFYYEHTDSFFQFTDTSIDGELLSRVCQEFKYEDLEECGCCGCYHPKDFGGDCRDDLNRF